MTLANKGRAPRGSGPGSQSALRLANTALITGRIASHGPATQAQLARATGLSPGTVASIVHDLVAQNRVKLEPITSSGRRAYAVRLVDNGQVVFGIDLGRTHARVLMSTLDHQVVAEIERALPEGHSSSHAVAVAAEMLQECYRLSGRTSEDAIAAGVAVPGPYNTRRDSIGPTTIVPEWVGERIAAHISASLGMPVRVGNDANLGALAHLTWSEPIPEDFLFVKVATGIGVGIVVRGEVYYGAHGVAGELGHTNVTDNGMPCRCGNRGCLETVASTHALFSALASAHTPPRTPEDIVTAALSGDISTLRVLEDAGLALGRVAGQSASLLDPSLIILSGPLAEVGEVLLEPIRRGLSRHTVPTVSQEVQVRWSELSGRAEALGAAALVLQEVHAGGFESSVQTAQKVTV